MLLSVFQEEIQGNFLIVLSNSQPIKLFKNTFKGSSHIF